MLSERNKTCVREVIYQLLGNLHTLRTEALYGERPEELARIFNMVEQDFSKIKYLIEDDENGQEIEIPEIF